MSTEPESPTEDPVVNALSDYLVFPASGLSIWLADEHPLSETTLSRIAQAGTVLVSNRFDQVLRAKQHGVEGRFSDFDLTAIESGSPNRILFRIAKEKPLTHYLINRSCEILPSGGELVLAGLKQEGIKTYIKKTTEIFGSKPELKRGPNQLQCARFVKGEESRNFARLDDSDYESLRSIGNYREFDLFSKPGQYGWQKIDPGSELLAEVLRDRTGSGHIASAETIAPEVSDRELGTVLDLGCGYGFLSLVAAELGARSIVATDNCAAALAACEKNLSANGLELNGFRVLPGDAADTVDDQFDTVLCNPPFHQGFKTSRELSLKFVRAMERLLKRSGVAWVVVNQFIPVDRLTAEVGLAAELLVEQNGFRVYLLSKD